METKEYLNQLKSCKTEQDFKDIWNPDKFNWTDYSEDFCIYCSKYINIWWDPDKFNWEYSYYLCHYCSKHFNIWWDSEKFDWKKDSDFLCIYCSKHFNIWWDPKKFNWSYLNYLQKHCQKYEYIWEKDYIKWKLKNKE